MVRPTDLQGGFTPKSRCHNDQAGTEELDDTFNTNQYCAAKPFIHQFSLYVSANQGYVQLHVEYVETSRHSLESNAVTMLCVKSGQV